MHAWLGLTAHMPATCLQHAYNTPATCLQQMSEPTRLIAAQSDAPPVTPSRGGGGVGERERERETQGFLTPKPNLNKALQGL